jgi:hypothetical protein
VTPDALRAAVLATPSSAALASDRAEIGGAGCGALTGLPGGAGNGAPVRGPASDTFIRVRSFFKVSLVISLSVVDDALALDR